MTVHANPPLPSPARRGLWAHPAPGDAVRLDLVRADGTVMAAVTAEHAFFSPELVAAAADP